MPSERSEHHATRQALAEVYDYISPGTNEGISFLVSRLTDDMFTDSFLGGGDISLFTAGGTRGVIKSNPGTAAQMLDSGGGAPTSFPIALTFDLNDGEATGSWTLPDGTQQAPSFGVQLVKKTTRPEGALYLFSGETSSDAAAYSLTLLLI
jgi:hypothetical protein